MQSVIRQHTVRISMVLLCRNRFCCGDMGRGKLHGSQGISEVLRIPYSVSAKVWVWPRESTVSGISQELINTAHFWAEPVYLERRFGHFLRRRRSISPKRQRMAAAFDEGREAVTTQPHPLEAPMVGIGSTGICIAPPSGNIPVSAKPRSRTRSSRGASHARVVSASASHSSTPVMSR